MKTIQLYSIFLDQKDIRSLGEVFQTILLGSNKMSKKPEIIKTVQIYLNHIDGTLFYIKTKIANFILKRVFIL